MPDALEATELNIEDVRNIGSCIPLLPRDMRKSAYLTGENDSPRRLNEDDSYTKKAISLLGAIFCITTVSEELDLAPALSIRQAARITKNFAKSLPDDLTDANLGPGL